MCKVTAPEIFYQDAYKLDTEIILLLFNRYAHTLSTEYGRSPISWPVSLQSSLTKAS